MGMQVGGGKGGALAEMNIVPLIDILLVLLIIFMVITPTTEMGLDALVPQPAPPNQKEDTAMQQKVVVVQIFQNGKVKINEEDSSWETLSGRLDQIFRLRAVGNKVAFVKGDENVNFSEVAKAIDIMRQAGIEQVGLLTPKMESSQ
ncbi:MAG: biopolymer transporter ExbD [Candidatus Acidiferrales bacterium]